MAYLLNIDDDLKDRIMEWGKKNGITTLRQAIIFILTQWLMENDK